MKTIKRSISTFGLLALASFSLTAHALQPLITDDTGTPGAGGNQVEMSWMQDRAKAEGETQRASTLPFVYTRGVTESIDLFAGVSYVRLRGDAASRSGAGNPSLGAKWRFYENEERGTSFAVKPELLLPVSSTRERDGLGAGKTSGNLTFIVSQEMPFGAVHLNAGVGRERFDDRSANSDATVQRFSLAPVWDVSEQWKLALDVGLESVHAGGERARSSFVEFGAVFSPDKNLDLAFGVLRTTDNDSPKTRTDSVTAGLTWRF